MSSITSMPYITQHLFGNRLLNYSVSQTDWTGGTSAYSNLEEGISHVSFSLQLHINRYLHRAAGSYWFVSAPSIVLMTGR